MVPDNYVFFSFLGNNCIKIIWQMSMWCIICRKIHAHLLLALVLDLIKCIINTSVQIGSLYRSCQLGLEMYLFSTRTSLVCLATFEDNRRPYWTCRPYTCSIYSVRHADMLNTSICVQKNCAKYYIVDSVTVLPKICQQISMDLIQFVLKCIMQISVEILACSCY